MKAALVALLLLGPLQDVRVHLEAGNKKLAAEDVKGAIEEYSKAIQLDPAFAPAYYIRGVAWGRQGDGKAAIADFSRCLELDPKNAFAWSKRGLERYFLGELDAARADLDRGLELYADDALSTYVRGLVASDQRRWADAVADFRKAAKLDPKGRLTYALRTWLARSRSGERAEADAELEAAVKGADPGAVHAETRKLVDFLAGRLPEAEYALEAKDPGTTCLVAFWIGSRRLLAGDREGAKEWFAKSAATKLASTAEYRGSLAALEELK